MYMLEDEGPFPLEGDCRDVLVLQQGDFLQAFMVLDNIRAIPTPEGYSPMGYLTTVAGIDGQLAPLANVYEVWPVNADGSVSAEQQRNQIMAVERHNSRMLGVREILKDSFPAARLEAMYPLWPVESPKEERTG